MTAPRRKLIEVALPLEAINAASAREKTIRHGHPATLHPWWARRPLATCRAVLFASLVDDPSSHPDEFPDEETQNAERLRLFRLIESLVKWENINDSQVLRQARIEIDRCTNGNPPPMLDPFAGSGAIPLEALRLGLEVYASDLNPVSVLITKAIVEIPLRFGGSAPVNPKTHRGGARVSTWAGASGLIEDLSYYGQWIRDQAEERLGHLYPMVKLPKEYGITKAPIIAWLWARTVKCPNPACGAQMPLIRSFVLSAKPGTKVWAEPNVDHSQRPAVVTFSIKSGSDASPDPTKVGRGSIFRCLACGTIAPEQHIKDEGVSGRMAMQLMAIAAHSQNGRIYLPPDSDQIKIAGEAQPYWKPEQQLAGDRRAIWCPLYGLSTVGDLFTNRQLVGLATFSDLISEAREKIRIDAVAAGLTEDGKSLDDGGSGALAYADAISTYLAFALDKLADLNNSLSPWEPVAQCPRNLFARQAIPMQWNFAEANPTGKSSGSWAVIIENLARNLSASLPKVANDQRVHVMNLDARNISGNGMIISTDPPYYDNIGYADLSDFFYVWLRRTLSKIYPSLFSTLLAPKTQELVAMPYRFAGSSEAAKEYFEKGLATVFERMYSVANPNYPLTIYYAFKQAEAGDEDESGNKAPAAISTGWETMLEALLKAGFQITGTWPMRTEMLTALKKGFNNLASSIVLVCRPRPSEAPLGTRREFQRALKSSLPAALTVLTSGRVAPVDLDQAAIGPGMAVFSAYAKVLEPDGRPMTLRAALVAINEVIQTYFAEQEGDLDPATQFCLRWYKVYGTKPGRYGEAESMSKGANISLTRLAREGLLQQGGGFVQLYPAGAAAYQDAWDPRDEPALTIWSATHHLVAAHRQGGNAAAAAVAAALGGVAEQARTLAYALYQVASAPGHGWTEDALGYNNLVADWPEIQRLAAAVPGRPTQLGFGV
ncbi:MAG TPA: DUF1156 domain-containing protein [Chloroflexia bacterium]|nr:DUF1156 domain-containing protein [Chloroflexia bacterium]